MVPRGNLYRREQTYSAEVVFPRPGSPIMRVFPFLRPEIRQRRRAELYFLPFTVMSGLLK